MRPPRASSASSAAVLNDAPALLTMTNGTVAKVATGTKSLPGSNVSFLYSAPLMACVPT
jgi:hypothetical protein